jgi:UrcA family protein
MKTILDTAFHLAATTAISGMLAFSAPVSAAPADAGPTLRVDLRGIDLASDDGIALAHRKVQTAARLVCPSGSDQQDLRQMSAQRACYDNATKTAYAQLDRIHLALTEGHGTAQTAMVVQTPPIPSGR